MQRGKRFHTEVSPPPVHRKAYALREKKSSEKVSEKRRERSATQKAVMPSQRGKAQTPRPFVDKAPGKRAYHATAPECHLGPPFFAVPFFFLEMK